jgi:hypothetical protein
MKKYRRAIREENKMLYGRTRWIWTIRTIIK